MEDLESLPEDEWIEVPEGLHAKFVHSIDRENNKLTITHFQRKSLRGWEIGFLPISRMAR